MVILKKRRNVIVNASLSNAVAMLVAYLCFLLRGGGGTCSFSREELSYIGGSCYVVSYCPLLALLVLPLVFPMP